MLMIPMVSEVDYSSFSIMELCTKGMTRQDWLAQLQVLQFIPNDRRLEANPTLAYFIMILETRKNPGKRET